MISVEEALAAVLAHSHALQAQSVSITNALGRVLTQDVVSDIDIPPYTKSMMDGFAMDASDVESTATTLTVVERINAGDVPTKAIASGEAARIMTGAPLPVGANAVVRIEDILESQPALVSLGVRAVSAGQNVLTRGSVIEQGTTVLPIGHRLSAVDIGLLAEVGLTEVMVQAAPRIAVLATGNELVSVGESLGPGQIRNSNGPMLCGLSTQVGGTPYDLGIGRDDVDMLSDLVTSGLQQDALILSGGVSAGDKDLIPSVLQSMGVKQVFHKVQLRPGKPLWFGVFQDRERVVPVFGLPGNPVSSFVCFWIFVRPALAAMSGTQPEQTASKRTITLASKFEHRGDRETYYPGRTLQHGSQPTVEPLAWRGSADLHAFAVADCLIRFEAGDRHYDVGETLEAVAIR